MTTVPSREMSLRRLPNLKQLAPNPYTWRLKYKTGWSCLPGLLARVTDGHRPLCRSSLISQSRKPLENGPIQFASALEGTFPPSESLWHLPWPPPWEPIHHTWTLGKHTPKELTPPPANKQHVLMIHSCAFPCTSVHSKGPVRKIKMMRYHRGGK